MSILKNLTMPILLECFNLLSLGWLLVTIRLPGWNRETESCHPLTSVNFLNLHWYLFIYI